MVGMMELDVRGMAYCEGKPTAKWNKFSVMSIAEFPWIFYYLNTERKDYTSEIQPSNALSVKY